MTLPDRRWLFFESQWNSSGILLVIINADSQGRPDHSSPPRGLFFAHGEAGASRGTAGNPATVSNLAASRGTVGNLVMEVSPVSLRVSRVPRVPTHPSRARHMVHGKPAR
jgi:hypothetical protein